MKVLVVSPHPDDEALGCGGVIRQHVTVGDQVHVLYLTSGELGCPGEDPAVVGARREVEAGVCSQILQTQQVTFWRLPDGQVANTSEHLARMRRLLSDYQPECIYAPHAGESHPDHAAAGRLVWQAGGGAHRCRFYEIWTPFGRPDELVDITPHVTIKRAAIRAHASQTSRNSFVEAILALNHYRGLMGGPNWMFAEAFRRAP